MPSRPAAPALGGLALLFLKLGVLAFGGPAAHIAMMRQEVVLRRKWMSESEFLDLLGAANLIPGPSSTELAIHIGFRRAGWAGLVLAGVCFILPAAVLVSVLAAFYQRWHNLPQIAGVMYGVKPVVVAIVLHALWGLARSALRTPVAILAALAGLALAALGIREIIVLLVCAAFVVAARLTSSRARSSLPVALVLLRITPVRCFALFAAPPATLVTSVTLGGLFLLFLKIGSITFGSGYVLLAFLQSDLVDRLHWLTSQQLLDAVAIGQVTPGPVFTTATFIGYLAGGVPGAIVSTIGIFLPGFLLVLFSGPFIPRIRQSTFASALLNGATVGSLSLIAWVLVALTRAALIDAWTAGIAVISTLLLFGARVNSAWLVLGGGVLGAVLGRYASS
ncbi:MAG: chromate efflux transporter [Acidobacteriaceae bacterium]|nr:chromate efflux transporter [Acidobacteriaceae bacterium]